MRIRICGLSTVVPFVVVAACVDPARPNEESSNVNVSNFFITSSLASYDSPVTHATTTPAAAIPELFRKLKRNRNNGPRAVVTSANKGSLHSIRDNKVRN